MTKTQLLDLCAQIEAYRVNPHVEHVFTRLREIARIIPDLLEAADAARKILDYRGQCEDVGGDGDFGRLSEALNKIPLSS